MVKNIIRILLVVVLLFGRFYFSAAQDYDKTILDFRKQYVKELLEEPRHPVKAGDERYLDFYEPDATYCVMAEWVPVAGGAPFMVPTHSGKNKPFKECGILKFTIHDTVAELHVYQILDMMNNAVHKDELFVPFNDMTNYEATFGGGRYIDLSTADIQGGQVKLDFNKCYNPYCAFGEGFSCPIPPDENHLQIEIRAGEKMYKKFLGR